MRAFLLSLLTAGALAITPSAAKADYYRPYHRHGYYGHYRPYYGGGYRYYRPYYSGYYRPYVYGSYYYPNTYAYPYAYSYYGYPAYGLGYTGPNVSLWYGF